MDEMDEPLVQLLKSIGSALGTEALAVREFPLRALVTGPDFRVEAAGAVVGYLGLRRPGTAIPVTGKLDRRGQDQWDKLQLLPNVLYSNGDQWALFRYGQLVGRVARLAGGVAKAGSQLTPQDDEFARVVTDFLTWMPEMPRTV